MTAPSPNRRYQQLRGHLAYLKLNAAADHLAQVLDDGSDEDHVTVLERLLAIEADATATRRRESRRRLAGLPAAWRIDDFDFDAQPSVDRDLIGDLATMRFIDQAGNVLFIGHTLHHLKPPVGLAALDSCKPQGASGFSGGTHTAGPPFTKKSRKCGARWGVDADHRDRLGVGPVPKHTLRDALDGALLGLAMADEDDRLVTGLAPLDDVEGHDTELFARFTEYVARLAAGLDRLDRPQPMDAWVDAIGGRHPARRPTRAVHVAQIRLVVQPETRPDARLQPRLRR